VSDHVRLLSVKTALTPYLMTRRDAAEVTHQSFSARNDVSEGMVNVFETAGILRRYLVKPLDRYANPLEWSERNAAYRYVHHPECIVVIGEIAVLPLCLRLPWLAVVYTVLNAAVLTIRVSAENAGLKMARHNAAG
jgi:isoprenylcysteine carboxyl methyltransferase (ICMT) family protein YpbQ